MGIDVKVRDTEKEDISFLYQWLSHTSSQKAYLPETQKECEVNAAMWMYYAPLKSCLTATVDGEPVGLALLQIQPFLKIKHNAEISIIVSPEYQKGGVGTFLMNELFKIAKERFKMEFVYLHVYEGSASIKFYKKLGFEKTGEQKKWIKEPESNTYKSRIWMQRDL